MTDKEIMMALKFCSTGRVSQCEFCSYYKQDDCVKKSANDAIDLIKRQQEEIDELTDRNAWYANKVICDNIKELNVIQEGYNIEQLKKRFRAEFEEKMELGVEDCINWADWLDCIASEMWEEVKSNDR